MSNSLLKKNQVGDLTQYNAEQINIIQTVKGDYQNGPFLVTFCAALNELATNRKLSHLDVKLLILILSYTGDKKMMIEPNVQFLMGTADYAEELGYSRSHKPHITRSFKRLEEFGYIRRDKKRKDLHILINPSMATNTSTRNFTKVWNQTALIFGNEERKVKDETNKKDQNWDSELPKQLGEKNG